MQMQKQANFYSIPECYVYIGQSAQQRGVLAAAAAWPSTSQEIRPA